jgi:hypothetical protein
MRVIALDPGITTGIAYGKINEGLMDFTADQAELKCLGLWNLLGSLEPDVIVHETFEFRQGKQRRGIELYPRNLIGVIQLYSEMNRIKLIDQSPAQAMDYWTNDKLKENDAYSRGKDHARDATRHLLYWFYFGQGYKYNEKGHRFQPMPLLLIS